MYPLNPPSTAVTSTTAHLEIQTAPRQSLYPGQTRKEPVKAAAAEMSSGGGGSCVIKYYNYAGVGIRNRQYLNYSQACRVGDNIECAGQGIYTYLPTDSPSLSNLKLHIVTTINM